MLLVYQIHAGSVVKWSPRSRKVLDAKKFITSLIEEKLNIVIDAPSVQGGTSTTGNVVRRCLKRVDDLRKIFYIDKLCRETYETILTNYPWVHIKPTIHKLLAHAPQIISDHNDGFDACNKLIRRYRERLTRKFSFEDNIRDIFVRLISQKKRKTATNELSRLSCRFTYYWNIVLGIDRDSRQNPGPGQNQPI